MKYLFLSILFVWGISLQAKQLLLVEYFFNPNCDECKRVSQLIFPELAEKAAGKYERKDFDLSDETNFLELISRLDALDDHSNEKVYVIIDRRIILGGLQQIEQKLIPTVQQEYPKQSDMLPMVVSKEQFAETAQQKMTLAAVILAGFLDGINPCVFTALIFFMSLLAAGHVGKKHIVTIGIVYVSGCFLTYLLLGIGLYQLLSGIAALGILKTIINYGTAIFLVILAALVFADAVNFIHQGATGLRLQLPDYWKEKVHSLMRNSRRNAFVLPGVFFLSVAVTLIESVCTGQVYIPTLLLLANSSSAPSRWWSYLLIYNLVFILPLLGVFILTLGGIRMQQFLILGRRNTLIAKILTGFFLLGLSIALFYLTR